MKPYPRYKPTGLAWLPSVPEHWDVRKAKFLIRVGNGSDPKTDGDIPVYGSGAASFKTCGEYKEGPCVLVGRKGATLHIPHYVEGKYWNVDTSFDVKTTSGDYSLRYYYYCATRFDYQYYIAQTTLPGMAKSDYLNMPLPVPPLTEQDRIVRYLDEKTAAIDELVRAKAREIELLRERKQALVSAAVIGRDISTKCTFGRDASTMRPRCGRAMGAPLPVYRLKELVRFFKGLNITKADLIPEGANVISYGQIHSKDNDGRSLKDSFLRHTSFELTNEAARLSFGDIVFADTSEDQAGIGNCVLNDRHDPVWAGYHTVTARPRNPEIAPYLTILFQSNWWRDQLRRNSDGVKVYSVTQRSLGNTWVPFPPLPEQRRIVAHLDSACSELDAAEVAIRKQISLLQELRTRLVSDAVTGAVEV